MLLSGSGERYDNRKWNAEPTLVPTTLVPTSLPFHPVMHEWLTGLREMVIDSERCPLTFAEFTLKEYMRDKNGAWIDEIPDSNDHSIDAARYAMMEDVLRG